MMAAARALVQPKNPYGDPHRDPITVPQELVDAEINRARTPEGRRTIINQFQAARERGLILGNWTLPEE